MIQDYQIAIYIRSLTPIYQEVTHRLHDTAYVPKETAVGAGLMVLRQKHSEAHSDLFNDTETKRKL